MMDYSYAATWRRRRRNDLLGVAVFFGLGALIAWLSFGRGGQFDNEHPLVVLSLVGVWFFGCAGV